MGAWGYGHSENDAALDFLADIEESGNPEKMMTDALTSATKAAYQQSYEACTALVAAVYVDKQVNGIQYSPGEITAPMEVEAFSARHSVIDLSDLQPAAVEALRNILSGHSELNELWAESGEDHQLWRNELEQLMNRLIK